jgi:hypothetical protein
VTVTPDSHGRFSAPMQAEVCPLVGSGARAKPITRRRCFVGEPLPNGVDTVQLVGAGKLIVTYP